jgi:hypothetical protein
MIITTPHPCDRMTTPLGTYGLSFFCLSDCCVFLVYFFLFYALNYIAFCPSFFYYYHHAFFLCFIFFYIYCTAIVYWIWINVLCITCFNFWKHTQTSRLGGGLTICPMTTSQSLDAWNPQLILRHMCLNHSLQCPHTIFTNNISGHIWDLFDNG